MKILVTAVILMITACRGVYDSEPLKLATITDVDEESVVITIPDTVWWKEPFEVSIRTYMFDCGQKEGPTRVIMRWQTATVMPFKRVTGYDGQVCPGILFVADQTATIRFHTTGLARVDVVGLTHHGDTLRIPHDVFVR